MEWKKSTLEQDLEREGWKFLTNISPDTCEETVVKHNAETREVRVEYQAFDCEGMPLQGYRAIYIREKAQP